MVGVKKDLVKLKGVKKDMTAMKGEMKEIKKMLEVMTAGMLQGMGSQFASQSGVISL
ncbi:hypothetical protein ACP70R_048219 [Stipagrostis hirtigluma subsp. patula]